MPLLELLPDIFVPTFEMAVKNAPLAPAIATTILDVSMTEHLNPPNQFGFRLNDPTLQFINKTDGRFTEGSRVDLSMGYVGNTRKLIVGEITALTADFPNSGPATLQVDGFDFLHRLTRGTTYRRFGPQKPDRGLADSDIVTQIAREMKLTPSVDATKERREARVQDHTTNLAFLQILAQENGYFFWVDGETLHFKQKPPTPRTPSTLKLEWRKTLLSFSPRLSTAGQVDAFAVRGWDPIQKQSFTARAERSGAAGALSPTGQQQIRQGTGGRSERVLRCDTGASSAQEAQALAERMLSDQHQSLITGSGTAVGNPDLRAGTLLELSGIGRFDGTYQVEQVTHSVGGGGYQTSFQVRQR